MVLALGALNKASENRNNYFYNAAAHNPTSSSDDSESSNDDGQAGGGGGGGGGGWYGTPYYSSYSGGGDSSEDHEYTYFSDADDDDEWEDMFRANFAINDASRNVWSQIHEAERNLDMLDTQKSFYDDQFDKQKKNIDLIKNHADAMAGRTSDNDYVKSLQDFQNMARNAATSMGGQYGTWAQSLNNILDEGWAQQNANNAYTWQYNLQDAQDNRDNQINDLIKNYNNELLTLENSKQNIDSNLKAAVAQAKSSLASNLVSLTEYDARYPYIGDWGGLQDDADVSDWFRYEDESIDGVTNRNYLDSKKEYENPTFIDNIKKGDQIAKKLAGYSTDEGALKRLTGSYSTGRR